MPKHQLYGHMTLIILPDILQDPTQSRLLLLEKPNQRVRFLCKTFAPPP